MKILLILLFPIATFAQTIYTTEPTPLHDTIMSNVEFTKRGMVEVHEIPYKVRKMTDIQLMMGMDRVYLPRTDAVGGNEKGARTRVLLYQPTINADIQPEELKLVEDLLLEIEKPGVYVPTGPVGPPPPPLDDTTKIDGELATYPSSWTHGPNAPAGWYRKTIAYGNAEGSTVTYKFYGTKIEL